MEIAQDLSSRHSLGEAYSGGRQPVLKIMKLFLLFSAVTKKEAADVEYNDALLRIVHDEEPTGVPMGVNIQVSHFNSYIHVLVCHGS